MKQAIIISGTPGTGKTTLAKKIAKHLHAEYLDVNTLIQPYHLAQGYDEQLKTYLINKKRLIKTLNMIINKSKTLLIIDSHLSHYLPKKYVKLCIITKCTMPILKQRLSKRGYTGRKIQENLDSERFDVCLVDAAAQHHTIRIIDTSKPIKTPTLKRLLCTTS
ncbi:MAG: adenylate kinase family protein [Nanoarchaeota archaeon]|nr:adenylate kinase family protein [Nanoarchaeota archaeon]